MKINNNKLLKIWPKNIRSSKRHWIHTLNLKYPKKHLLEKIRQLKSFK